MATASLPSPDEDKRSGASSRGSQEGSVEDGDSLDLTGHHPTRDILAEGIVSLLSPTLKTLDEGVIATKRSQEDLAEQIALLTEQLQAIAAEQTCPIDLNGYVTRLGDIKGKINVISSVLHNAQDRLNRVHEQAIKEASRRKPLLEPSPSSSRGSQIPHIKIGPHKSTDSASGGDETEYLEEHSPIGTATSEEFPLEPQSVVPPISPSSPLTDPLTDSSSSSY